MNDTELARTLHRLLATVLDDHDAVQLEVEQGVVYLEGITRTASQKQRIEQIIRRVAGVRQVFNCLALEHIANLQPGLSALLPGVPPTPYRAPASGGFGIS